MKIKEFFARLLKNKTALIIIIASLVFIAAVIVILSLCMKKDSPAPAETAAITETTDAVDTSDDTTAEGEGETEAVTDTADTTVPETDAPAAPPVTAEPVHVHQYASLVTNPTCTEQGYTVHTCACGATYTDSYTAACHDFLKSYVCHRCGKPDPESSLYGLCEWVKNRGTELGKGDTYNLEYTFGSEDYSINFDDRLWDAPRLTFSCRIDDREVSLCLTDNSSALITCEIWGTRYNESGAEGVYRKVFGSLTVNNADISSGMNLLFSYFEPYDDGTVTNEQFSADAKDMLLHAMQVFQDRILYPETEFTFRTLGLTNY